MAETFLYLTTIGRVTGNPHQIEIWYVEHENSYYLCSEYPDTSDWVQNIQHNPSVSFYISERGQSPSSQDAHATIVRDDALLAILREKFDTKYNWSNGTFVEISADEDVGSRSTSTA